MTDDCPICRSGHRPQPRGTAVPIEGRPGGWLLVGPKTAALLKEALGSESLIGIRILKPIPPTDG